MQTLLARPHEAVTELGLAAAFPRMQPQSARALSHLYSRCAAIDISLRGKAHRFEWRMPDAALAEHESFRFKLGAHTGHVGIDLPALCTLLGERRIELLPRELRYVLWADALHAVASAVESRTRLRFEWAPADDPAERCKPEASRAAHFVFRSADAGAPCRGFLQFEDAAALDIVQPLWPLRSVAPNTALDALLLPLPFLLGTTDISLREVRGVRPGDIISIEDWGTAGTALRVSARFGGAAGRELMGLAEGSRITIHHTRDHAMNREPAAASALPDDNGEGQLPLDRLDALEVTLRFEVGDLSLSLGELRNIRAGHVFELAQPLNRSAVRILAHGNVLGKGHLVAVGDKLGVRVSEFTPSEL